MFCIFSQRSASSLFFLFFFLWPKTIFFFFYESDYLCVCVYVFFFPFFHKFSCYLRIANHRSVKAMICCVSCPQSPCMLKILISVCFLFFACSCTHIYLFGISINFKFSFSILCCISIVVYAIDDVMDGWVGLIVVVLT